MQYCIKKAPTMYTKVKTALKKKKQNKTKFRLVGNGLIVILVENLKKCLNELDASCILTFLLTTLFHRT